MSKPKVVSIYSGCGGIDIGFIEAGFDVVFASDIWALACDSLKINHTTTEVVCGDIQSLDFKSILKKHQKIDCLVGGPPCPPFSKSRFYRTEKNRGIDDKSGEMTLREYFRAVKELNPTVFLFENVHGFVYRPHASALEFLQKQANELGYKISYSVVNAANYGVPQTRERFICIGYRVRHNYSES